MASSAGFSTKVNVPSIIRANGCRRILDVGCADGSFTQFIAGANPRASVEGLDINPECLKEAERRCSDFRSITFTCGELADVEGEYDCIVFSSVMHEISSYCNDEKKRYTEAPIEEAFKEAYKRLARGGIIVVRDWVDCTRGHLLRVRFKSPEYSEMFKRFFTEFPAMDKTFAGGKMVFEDKEIPDGFMITEKVLLEYLMVATWGKESWEREINERKFICNKDKWYGMAEKAGLTVVGWLQTTEEYPLYCERIVEATLCEKKWRMPDTTFVMVCRK